jgi:ectoine hydroxylase-related dioxygenase (phytanoyl-CoA dioxygenase family)
MLTGLLSKSHAYALTVESNEIWHQVNEYFVTSTLKNSWVFHPRTPQTGPRDWPLLAYQSHTSISKPQLSTTVTFSVQPGTTAQGLHRDDDIYHTWHPASKEHHHQGRDTMLCFFVASSKCTRENGATRIIPSSHLWDYDTPPLNSTSDDFFAAEREPGDAFMMLGGIYYSAGSNTTTDEERLVYAALVTRGYLRQEETST